jgi:F-type H+-transporting ATPase subunit delta
MRDPTIARNYAEALVSLARKANDLTGWGTMISDVADAITRDERLRLFLESPRVPVDQKNEVIAKAFQDRMPRLFVRFLQSVIRHRRQALIPEIAVQYHALVDEIEGRIHAQVTISRAPDGKLEKTLSDRLSKVLGKAVVPHFTIDETILGGTIIRVGDTVMDGSVKRKLTRLRQRMMTGA